MTFTKAVARAEAKLRHDLQCIAQNLARDMNRAFQKEREQLRLRQYALWTQEIARDPSRYHLRV